MTLFYSLRIHIEEHLYLYLDNLLGVVASKEAGWAYEVIQKEDDDYFDFVQEFLKILEGKEAELASRGISSDDITFWMLYEYDGQCNMEFSPVDMKRLGEKGYTLCISCYEG